MANHWRIESLEIIIKNPGITLEEIVKKTGGNFKTLSEHIRKMKVAGLINKKYSGRSVTHTASPYGEKFYKFLSEFE